jgi:hypothetical protein
MTAAEAIRALMKDRTLEGYSDDYSIAWNKALFCAKVEAQKEDEKVKRLSAALWEARGMVESWGAYADEYFQDKWDLKGDLAKLDAAIAEWGAP